MPRLIDADKARKEATIDLVVHLLDRQPTIDAVPVVRCKDCKYSFEDNFDGSLWCCRGGEREVVETHFCSYGERKE